MNPQALNDANTIYNPAIQAIQGQQPAIQQLYNTLIQGLQSQQGAQVQNVVASADQRGVGRAGLAGDVNTQLGAATNLAGAQLGMQNAQNIGNIQQLAGKTNAGRVQAAGDFTGTYQKQSLENQSNQLAMTDIERKAMLEQQANQRAFEIRKVEAASKAYSQASQLASGMDLEEFVSLTEAGLKKKMGGDGNVSPETFKQALALWTNKGLPASEFINKYSGFINKSHIQDYFSAGNAAPQNNTVGNMSQLRY